MVLTASICSIETVNTKLQGADSGNKTYNYEQHFIPSERSCAEICNLQPSNIIFCDLLTKTMKHIPLGPE